MTLFQRLRRPTFWAPGLVLVLVLGLAALTAAELRRAERDATELQLSNIADGLGAMLQMHLAECEQALRAASLVASADPGLAAPAWQAIARQARVGEFDACPESLVYLDAGGAAGDHAGNGAFVARRVLVAPAAAGHDKLDGFEPWRDAAHLAAMEAARDHAEPRLSTRASWPGMASETHLVVWYMPVYQREAVLDSPEARAAALTGYVATPIRVPAVVEALSRQLPDARLALECHSGASELFDGAAPAAGNASASTLESGAPTQLRVRTLRVGGRWWTLQAGIASSHPELLEQVRPSAISLLAGVPLSVLLAGVAWLLLSQSARAHALANDYSRDARERELRLRSVLDGTRDGIFTLNTRGDIVGANLAVQQILGYCEQELLQLSSSTLMAPERKSEYAALWVRFVRSARERKDGHWPVHELELRHHDGSAVQVRSSLSLVQTEAGEFVVWLIGDVTRERDMERRAQHAALLNQAIMDAVPISVMTIDGGGSVASANRASYDMLGYEPSELLGCPVSMLRQAEPDTARDSQFGTETGSHDGAAPLEKERTWIRKNGSAFPTSEIAMHLHEGIDGSPVQLRVVMDITERKRAAAKIEHMALHDSLTGLPNRVLLQDRAGRALLRAQRNSGGFALMLLDLDRFKQINDTLGHAAGDDVLKTVAQRLVHTVRASDTVVRMGGDEFAILLPEVMHAEQALEVANKILAAMAEDMLAAGHRLQVTPSVGVALFPEHGNELSTLLRNADAAMYDAKARGRNAASLYCAAMSSQANMQFEMQAALRQALARDEFVLHYQPLVDADTGEVRALEALLRWQHPQRGLVPPADFIPLAEDTGLIVPIGTWVLGQACTDLARLRAQGRPGLRVAVNLSPRQFMADGLEESVVAALQATGLPGDALELEITESVLMSSLERTQLILSRLRALGVRFAIDDFGTGYSSLSYLANFPVQTVKVDRSFVRQIDSGEGTALLASAIVAMAHSLGLDVVAEGVETPAQCNHLIEVKCELLQGYLFSKPVRFEQLAAAMAHAEAVPRQRGEPRVEVWAA